MAETTPIRVRQVVDWSAAVWAGIIAGMVTLLLNVFVMPMYIGGNGWLVIRYFASIALGEGVLPPPSSPHAGALVTAIVMQLVLSVAFTLVLAFIIHRGGLVAGVLGGAAFGLGVYCINFFLMTRFFDHFNIGNSFLVFSHLIFGALAGGLYEALEVEEFIPIDEQSEGAPE